MGELKARLIRRWEDLPVDTEGWHDLLPREPRRNVFMSLERLRIHWENGVGCKRLLIVALEEDGRDLSYIPLIQCVRRRGMVRFRTLEILGGEEADLASFPLPPDRPEALRKVFDLLAREVRGWDVLWLSQLDANNPVTQAIDEEARRRGLSVERQITALCPTLPLDRPFEDLFLGLFERKSRNKRTRALRNLQEHPGVEIHRLKPDDDLDRLFDGMAMVEQCSWKGEQSVGIFTPERDASTRELLRALIQRGLGRAWWITHSGRMISYRVGFLCDGVYSDYQTAFLADPEVEKLSPSRSLMQMVIEELCQEDVSRFDFGPGTQRYKLEWATGLRENCLLRIYNRTLRARALCALSAIKTALRGTRRAQMEPLPIAPKDPLPPYEGPQGEEKENGDD